MPAPTLAEQISVARGTDGVFVSRWNAEEMGPATAGTVFGGCTLGVGINAASQTVDCSYHVYSILGHFVSPAVPYQPLYCKVESIRDTKTFATRRVEICQKRKDGSEQLCAVLQADFQASELRTLLDFAAAPERMSLSDGVPKVEEQDPSKDSIFSLIERYFSVVTPKGSLARLEPNSIVSKGSLTQDRLPLPKKTFGQWNKARHPLPTTSAQVAALAFFMDAAVGSTALSHSRTPMSDIQACSSLDVALRIFSNDLDLTNWHYKEVQTICGGGGRTYNEGRLWDEKGEMIASMTQQVLLRPTSSVGSKL